MTSTAARARAYSGPPLFSFGFRPFFLAASVWAAVAVPIWTLAFLSILPTPFTERDWHVHEMLFGYLAGVIAGFLLTAVPNWTGRLPVIGAPLAWLSGLWLAGRFAMLMQPVLGIGASVVDCAFLVAFALVIWREVLAGKNTRNIPVCILVSALAVANVAFHLRLPTPDGVWLGERIALAVGAMLVALIGGRVTPSFTRNWMAKRAMAPEPRANEKFDIFALLLTGVALIGWLIAPVSALAGYALVAAGAALVIRLARWRGWVTTAEPLVLILHTGYLWLAVAIVLLGAGALAPATIPASAGIHALTAGAFGTMTLAMMTRATLGHTGCALTADRRTQAIYVLVNLGALARVAAALTPSAYAPLLVVSSLFWSGSFLLFVLAYGPLLVSKRRQAA